METLDDLADFIKNGVDGICSDFTSPDDDWMPVMFVQNVEKVTLIPLPVSMFETGTGKDLLAVLLKKLIRELEGIRYGLLLNVHGVSLDKNKEDAEAILEAHRDRGLPIKAIPGSYEMLWLTVGDAEQEVVWTNKIVINDDAPRTLEGWNKMEGYKKLEGRFVNMGEELRRVDAVPDS